MASYGEDNTGSYFIKFNPKLSATRKAATRKTTFKLSTIGLVDGTTVSEGFGLTEAGDLISD